MEVQRWPSLHIDRSKSKQEAEVLLSVVSLNSSSVGYIWPIYFSVWIINGQYVNFSKTATETCQEANIPQVLSQVHKFRMDPQGWFWGLTK